SGWSRPPYDGVIEGGRLYGRGASDNKGALASVLVAASRVKDEIEKSNLGKLTIAAVADEEQGNTYGMHYLIEEAGFKPDYAIVCEPTGCTSVVVAEKGILRVKLRSKGRLAHGSRPQEGINAITKLSKVLVKLEEFTMSYEPHPLFSPPTLNVGVIVGGEAVNVVPSECTCLLDIRYLPGQEPGHILSEIEELIATVKRMDPQVDIDVEMVGAESPIVTSQDHPLIKLISESSLNVAGFSPKITGIGGGTVAKVLVKKGISSVVYGPGEESVCHRADEYVDVSQLKLASQIYGIVMLNFKGYLEAHRRV
ncbi:MAG: ArgE/DapE family deacylase, partial [Thermoproteota archaeon]